jgi:hypothetical protein
MVTPALLEETPDFSLVLGGPLYKLLSRSHSASSVPHLLRRQAATVVLVCWIPLAVLSLAQDHFVTGKLSFLRDIETHVRFLVSLPVLILAEIIVYQRIRPIVRSFIDRQIVAPEDYPRFYSAIRSAVRIHNSFLANNDIQSLADLGKSFAMPREMRAVPIATDDILLLFAVTISPFLPLLLTIMPLHQLVMRAMRVIF